MPNVGRKAEGAHTQSVLFEKSEGWTKTKSRDWLEEHNYYTDGYDETDEHHRWRQYDPEEDKFNYRNTGIGDGITLVRGYPKNNETGEERMQHEIRLYDVIGIKGYTAEDMASQIPEGTTEIIVRINSPGGDV